MPQSYTSYINGVEDSNWYACTSAAAKAGYSSEEAELCDNGSLNCPTCPWKKSTAGTQGEGAEV